MLAMSIVFDDTLTLNFQLLTKLDSNLRLTLWEFLRGNRGLREYIGSLWESSGFIYVWYIGGMYMWNLFIETPTNTHKNP